MIMKVLTKAKQAQIDRAVKLLESQFHYPTEKLTASLKSKQYFTLRLALETREHFEVAYLDNQHGLIETVRMFSGTVNACNVWPRELARKALLLNASAVVLAHNHPSGLSQPSSADKNITDRIAEALGLFDIKVLDHLIIAKSEVFSFAESGLV
jgi:DNA repair protein RadC